MATANDSNLERGHLIEELLTVLHNVVITRSSVVQTGLVTRLS